MYNEIITEYSKNPINRGTLENYSIKHFEENRTCGDSLELYLLIGENGEVKDFSFIGNTAIITTACVSIFGESIIGVNIQEILNMDYEYIKGLIEMDVSSRRKKASVLGVLATRNAIHKYLNDGAVDDFSDVL